MFWLWPALLAISPPPFPGGHVVSLNPLGQSMLTSCTLVCVLHAWIEIFSINAVVPHGIGAMCRWTPAPDVLNMTHARRKRSATHRIAMRSILRTRLKSLYIRQAQMVLKVTDEGKNSDPFGPTAQKIHVLTSQACPWSERTTIEAVGIIIVDYLPDTATIRYPKLQKYALYYPKHHWQNWKTITDVAWLFALSDFLMYFLDMFTSGPGTHSLYMLRTRRVGWW